MKNYVKPMVVANDGLAESVYMASGSECYTVTSKITQTPENGRENYCVHTDASHNATDGHHSTEQYLTIYFNQAVTYSSCQDSEAECAGGDGTSALVVKYKYHNNAVEKIGLGDVYVTSGSGLAVTGSSLSCNYKCNEHDGLNN